MMLRKIQWSYVWWSIGIFVVCPLAIRYIAEKNVLFQAAENVSESNILSGGSPSVFLFIGIGMVMILTFVVLSVFSKED